MFGWGVEGMGWRFVLWEFRGFGLKAFFLDVSVDKCGNGRFFGTVVLMGMWGWENIFVRVFFFIRLALGWVFVIRSISLCVLFVVVGGAWGFFGCWYISLVFFLEERY